MPHHKCAPNYKKIGTNWHGCEGMRETIPENIFTEVSMLTLQHKINNIQI